MKIEIQDEYEELFDLIGCYFNQDWKMEANSVEESIKNYLSEFQKTSVDQCLFEIGQILEMVNQNKIDAEHLLLEDFDVGYDYPSAGFTGKEWLEHIRNLILELRKTVNFQPSK